MDRESKRVKAITEYHSKKNKVAGSSQSAADQKTDQASHDADSSLNDGLIQDFSTQPSNKKAAKIPARFARIQQKMDAQEEVKKEQEQKKLVEVEPVDLSQRLPSEIYSQLKSITEKLELGLIGDALKILKIVKQNLQDPSKFSSGPANLELEYELHQSIYAYRQGLENPLTGELYKKMQKFVVQGVDSNHLKDSTQTRHISMRDLIKAKRITKALEENDYKPVSDKNGAQQITIAQAVVYNYFSSLITYPMYVHSDNANDAAQFVILSLELGGFPLVDAVFEENKIIQDVQQICQLQKQLMTSNFYSYKSNFLHQLAMKQKLQDKEKEILTNMLSEGSFQRQNLWQKDYLSRIPLAIAFENQNLDFIQIVAHSQASLDQDWSSFFDLNSYKFNQILIDLFTPQKQTELAKMREQQEQEQSRGLSRFQFLTSLLKELKVNLEMRISSGKEDSNELLMKVQEFNKGTVRSLQGIQSMNEREKTINMVSKLHKTTSIDLQENFQKGSICFQKDESSIKELEQNLSTADRILLRTFDSLQLKSGYLIQQLSISANSVQEVEYFASTTCPGFKYQLFRQVIPLFKIDDSLDCVLTEHFPIRFPFSKESDFTYCYPLKLSMLFNPENVTMHELILSQIDLNAIEPFLLEIICLIGLSLGTENQYFQNILAKKPWLFGEKAPQFEYVKSLDRKKVPKLALDLYSEEAYIQMVITLGKILIRNHKVALFKEFFLSQNCMFMNSAIVSTLIIESLTYLVPECCVPIFALCSSEFNLLLDDNQEKKVIDYQSNKSDMTVNEMEIQESLLIQKVIFESSSLQLIDLLKVCSQDIADQIVSLMLEHNAYGMHLRSYTQKILELIGQDVSSISISRMSLDFMRVIYKHCSIKVTTKFIESEWSKCQNVQNDSKLMFLSQLISLFANTTNQIKMEKIDQSSHFKNFQKKTHQVAIHQFKDSCSFPDQLELIEESLSDQSIALDISGRLGIPIESYIEVCEAALEHNQNFKQRQQQRYHYQEIGASSSGPIKKSDINQSRGNQRVKIKAILQNTPTREGILEEVVQWRKFEKVQHIALQIIDSELPPQQLMSLLSILTHDRSKYATRLSTHRMQARVQGMQSVPEVNLDLKPFEQLILEAFHHDAKAFAIKWKFLMLKPLILRLFEKLADSLFPLAKEAVKSYCSYKISVKRSKETNQPKPMKIKDDLNDVRKMLLHWSFLFSGTLLKTLFPSLLYQKQLRNQRNYHDSQECITDTHFRITYVNLIDKFTSGMTSILEKIDGQSQSERFYLLLIVQMIIDEDDRNSDFFNIFYNNIAVILSNAREITDEPIQQEPYLPLLRLFERDYKLIIANKNELFGENYTKIEYYFSKILRPTLPYLDEELIQLQLSKNEGEYNAFNFMQRQELSEILKRTNISKDLKLLAIRRYLDSSSKEKKDGFDSEAYLNLVSYTTFFSDRYAKTAQSVGKVVGDAKMLLLDLIKSHQLYSDFIPGDLPSQLEESFADERLLFVVLQTPPKDSSQERGYLSWLSLVLSKIPKPDKLLAACPRLFSWSSRVLFKSCRSGFDTFCAWFEKVSPGRQSLLSAEVESQENKNKLLVDLISEGRYEIVDKIKSMIEGTPLWNELKVIRTMVGSDRKNENRYRMSWQQNNQGFISSDSEEDSEETKQQQLDPVEFMALPYFAALSSCQFELCQALIPDSSTVLEPAITMEEQRLLASKLSQGSINPIQLKDQAMAQKLKDIEDEVTQFQGVQSLGMLTILRLVPNFDPKIFIQSVNAESKRKHKDRQITNMLIDEALQHVEIALTYIDIGLLKPSSIVSALLKKCETKRETLTVLIALLMRYRRSEDIQTQDLLEKFNHEIQSCLPSDLSSRNLSDFLQEHMANFRNQSRGILLPTFEQVFTLKEDQFTHTVLMLLNKDSTQFKKEEEQKFQDQQQQQPLQQTQQMTNTMTFGKNAPNIQVQQNSTIAISTPIAFTDLSSLQDQIFVIGKFWLNLMIHKEILFDIPLSSNKEDAAAKQNAQRPIDTKNEWIWSSFWNLDLKSQQQMQEISQLFHQMVIFDPLVFHLQKQNFYFWSAVDSRYSQQQVQAARAKRLFVGRRVIDCIKTNSDENAMVAFIAKKILRIGYYEVVDDDDDLREEALVQFDHNKAMSTIFTTLMLKCPSNSIDLRIQRAQTILKSFSEEIATQLSPPLPVVIECSMQGKPIKFEMNISDFNCAIDILQFLEESVAEIRSIPDISHVNLYSRVFEPGVVYESSHQAFNHLTQAFSQVIGDSAYIEELRRMNVKDTQEFIFDGFFNKIIESFTSEYAIQFSEVIVDPQIDLQNLKSFLEEAMQSQDPKDVIESIFTQIQWSQIEEILTDSCDIEVFSQSRLIIKRVQAQDLISNSKENFLANASLFKSIETNGLSQIDIVLPLCFNESNGRIEADLNQFLPYIYILNHFGSKTLMCNGKPQNFSVVNRPILKADMIQFCQYILEAKDIVPKDIDFMSYLTKLGFTSKVNSESDQDNPNSPSEQVNELAIKVTREVNDCKMQYKVASTSKIPFTYSKLATILVLFKNLGEPSYPDTLFEFGYADMDQLPYENLSDELAQSRSDLVMLGKNHKQVRENQTEAFIEMGFTRRPKSIRSIVATITVNCRIRNEAQE